jgi:hypothetical protein
MMRSRYPEVTEGYKAFHDVIANKILKSDVAVLELLLTTNAPKMVSVRTAQRPLRYPFISTLSFPPDAHRV